VSKRSSAARSGHSQRRPWPHMHRLGILSGHLAAAAAEQGGKSGIARTLPPYEEPSAGVTAAEKHALETRCAELRGRMAAVLASVASPTQQVLLPDVGALVKAVEFALRFGEWYSDGDGRKAESVLEEAEMRLSELEQSAADTGAVPSWEAFSPHRPVVRGYTSQIDGSDQPYGLEMPAGSPPPSGWPLYVWLHGRGSQATDLHFVAERMAAQTNAASGGRARPTPSGALVLHPFGRQCVGWKWAGELDVLDAVAHVRSRYHVDPERIVLAGFSMVRSTRSLVCE
jgi:hypothetical protein